VAGGMPLRNRPGVEEKTNFSLPLSTVKYGEKSQL